MSVTLHDLASLDVDDANAILAQLSEDDLKALEQDWIFLARPEQVTPAGDWTIWLILAGRGWGKTRSAAEDVKEYGLTHPMSRIAIVAPTYQDARDTCVEGESGLLSILPKDKVQTWNRSLGELVLTNGTRYKLFSADEPDRLRGPQHHRAWFEELCAAKYPQRTWDNLMFGLRLGDDPRVVVTTTPKPIKLLKDLLKRVGRGVHLTKGNTFDNAANLAKSALQELKARYLGTRIGRQELFAEVLEDNPRSLWKRDTMIEALRVQDHPPLKRIVVAIDPPASDPETSSTPDTIAEAGIVVAGLGTDDHGYLLADRSQQASPEMWARLGINAYQEFDADNIVGEVNNGGAMVGYVVRNVAKDMHVSITYKEVRATRGKMLRAEPVSTLAERGLLHHVGNVYPELEDQLCQWEQGQKSPDRLDAYVWAFTELMLDGGDIPVVTSSGAVSQSPHETRYTSSDEDENARLQERQARLSAMLNTLRGGLR